MPGCHNKTTCLIAGLYTLKTSVRHVKFLDLAYANNLTVVATYEIGVAMKTPLVSLTDLAVAKHQLRLQIRSSIHKGALLSGPPALHIFTSPLC